ncbi:porin family protein [Mesonia aestuariivivens]|uniref:PorT family protein n=1 Tax=Mesonia aestuariivivens TaxID=2796128 RepID=A0ABS6W061_9FLAO|nr:porin family protein [Mesonia aestuariivivens]MBW2961221.1 PorT family protein [Mesonia aestuariivivens]
MKKLLLVFGLAICGTFFSYGQNFEIGGQVGYGISNVYTDDDSADSKGVFHIGAVAQYNFNEDWSLVGELLYDQKGYSYTDGTDGEESINYLSVPVMAKYNFGSSTKFYLQAGLYGAFLLSAEGEFEGRDVDTKDAYESTDFGVAFGLGVEFPIQENLKLFVDLVANSGFSNIAAESDFDITNGATKAGVGLRYSLN